jgi:hypothetical protein
VSKQEAEMTIERQNLIRYYELGKSVTRVKSNGVRDTHDTLLRCRDGGYIKIVLNPEKQWEGLCKALGNPEWTKMEMFSDNIRPNSKPGTIFWKSTTRVSADASIRACRTNCKMRTPETIQARRCWGSTMKNFFAAIWECPKKS